MGIIKTINDLIEGVKVDNPIELGEYFEARKIPHYYYWNSPGVPISFDSIKENHKMLFSIEILGDKKWNMMK